MSRPFWGEIINEGFGKCCQFYTYSDNVLGSRVLQLSGDLLRLVGGVDGGDGQAGPDTVELRGEQVSNDGREGGEEGSQKDTDFPDINGDIDGVEKMVDGAGSDHETGVDGSSDNPTQGVPSSVVKPVVETVESMFRQVLGCAIVEVGIELVNYRFKPGTVFSSRSQTWFVFTSRLRTVW